MNNVKSRFCQNVQCSWWLRLFQKRAVYSELYIYKFATAKFAW